MSKHKGVKRIDLVLQRSDLQNLAYLRRAAGIQGMQLAIKFAIRVAAIHVCGSRDRLLARAGGGGAPQGYRPGPPGPVDAEALGDKPDPTTLAGAL